MTVPKKTTQKQPMTEITTKISSNKEFYDIIKKLKQKKAAGPDEINFEVIIPGGKELQNKLQPNI